MAIEFDTGNKIMLTTLISPLEFYPILFMITLNICNLRVPRHI